jgi:hypothetical protein
MQATGGDAVDALRLELQQKGFSCWYDQTATDLTTGISREDMQPETCSAINACCVLLWRIAGGMMNGIAKADRFILFLSDQCLSRPFVQNEVREAIKLGRKVSVLRLCCVLEGR